MKDMITAIGSILLLMIFVMQSAGSQAVHTRLFQADLAVESFRDALKEDGRITEENRSAVIRALGDILDCSEDQILVEAGGGADAPAYQGSHIYYRIRFPLQNLIVMGSALGLTPEENMVWFDQEGWVVSRFEKPDNNPGDSSADDHGNSV